MTPAVRPNRLKELRNAAGKTAIEIAQMLGVREPTVFRYESGEIALSIDTAQELARIYGCTLDDIFPVDAEASA